MAMTLQFKIKGYDTYYQVQPITPDEAHNVGCPTAECKIISPRTTTTYYGQFTSADLTNEIKVPSTTHRGYRAHFETADQDTVLDGYLIKFYS